MDYGKSLLQILEEAVRDFYRVCHNLFVPTILIINNTKIRNALMTGKMNAEALRESFSVSG
jgi:methenyltetrahydromethanopterin cyclohydrolase